MAFRANEEREKGYERALNYLVPKEGSPAQKDEARNKIIYLINKYGPVIDTYPTWHPIVSCFPRMHNFAPADPRHIESYDGLDHTILLAHGFISCPYQGADKLIEKINNLHNYNNISEIEQISNKIIRNILLDIINNKVACIKDKRLDIPLYNIKTETIFVKCEWSKSLSGDGMIPKNIAIPLMLERELPCWRFAECAENWQSVRGEMLGSPYGRTSSLFVNQETGQAMKTIWNAIIKTGMFGLVMKIPK